MSENEALTWRKVEVRRSSTEVPKDQHPRQPHLPSLHFPTTFLSGHNACGRNLSNGNMGLEAEVVSLAISDPQTAGPSKPAPSPKSAPKSKPPARASAAAQDIRHPKFIPEYLPSDASTPFDSAEGWIVPLRAPAYFPLDVFHTVLEQQALHPEQNSSLILRAEQLPNAPREDESSDDELAAKLGLNPEPLKRLRVRFVPRQARRDVRLTQRNVAYSADIGTLGMVLKAPEANSAADMPYYHPPVRRLAFIWEADESGEGEQGGDGEDDVSNRIYGWIYVAYLPFDDTPTPATNGLGPPPKPPRKRSPLAGPSAGETVAPPATVLEDDSPEGRDEARVLAERRLQRTCLHLLEKLHKHGHGTLNGYVKRVHHDVSTAT